MNQGLMRQHHLRIAIDAFDRCYCCLSDKVSSDRVELWTLEKSVFKCLGKSKSGNELLSIFVLV